MTSSPRLWLERLQNNRPLLVLLAAGSLAVMPGAVIAPVLPEIVAQLGLDQALAGYLVSAHYLTIAIASPLLGILADRHNRIQVLAASLALFSVFGVAGALMQSFLPMLATRALLGVATGGVAAGSLGLLARMYTDEQKRTQAIAYASSTITLANIVYPLLAGIIGSTGWRFAFGLYGLGLPLAIAVALCLQDEGPRSSKGFLSFTAGEATLANVLGRPRTLQLLLSLFLSAATAYAAVIYLPLYLKATLQTETITNGLVLASQAIGAAVASAFAASFLTRRLGTIPAIALGLCVMASAAAAIPHMEHLSGILPVAIVFGLGLGTVVPSHYAALADLAPLELQSTVLATGTGANFLGQFFSPTLFGLVVRQRGLGTVFYAVAIVALLTALFLLISTSFRSKRGGP